MADRLGISSTYVSSLENNRKQPSDAIVKHVDLLERAFNSGLFAAGPPSKKASASDFRETLKLAEDEAPYRVRSPAGRLIPVLGWAHAGEAATYEELPESWQDQVPTECRDVKAFAVRLEGESMEPKFSEGDLLILQPSKQPYNGCLAVCRFQNDGIVFRRLELLPGKVRLMALNPLYPPSEHSPEDFSWIYPVWGRWTQIWK